MKAPGPAEGVAPPPLWCPGNDVVDLEDPRCLGKASDRRFLERVFAPEERRRIQEAPDPETTLWIVWAAKEAAFKTLTRKLGAPPTFRHARFRVTLPAGPAGPAGEGGLRGLVRYGEEEVPFRGTLEPPAIHLVSWQGDPASPPPVAWGIRLLQEVPPGPLTPREEGCASHPASARARLAARRALSAFLGAAEDRLEIGCEAGPPGRRPPRVYLDGAPAPLELSLSHHGRFVAWAFTTGPGAPFPQRSRGR